MTPTPAKGCTPRILRPEAEAPLSAEPRYTIGTLVTDRAQYAEMLASFRSRGFCDTDCEFLFVDNTQPLQTDAFRGLNALLNAAHAPVVILCHQDVRLLNDNRAALDRRLSDLAKRDCNWALAGNAGGVSAGRLALCISDPHGKDQRIGQFPERVMSLDENFIVVRREARVGFSADLSGFHFYGADICLHASQMGYSAYVIDFHLEHLSPGKKDHSFAIAETAFRAKWTRALTPRWVQTTCSLIHLTGAPARNAIGRLIDAPLARLARRLPSARGWKQSQKSPV
jgi:hypothetical protein